MGFFVDDEGGLVGMPLAFQHIDAVELDAGSAAQMAHARLEALAFGAGGEDGLAEDGARREFDLGEADADGVGGVVQQNQAVDYGPFADADHAAGVGDIARGPAFETVDQGQSAGLAHLDRGLQVMGGPVAGGNEAADEGPLPRGRDGDVTSLELTAVNPDDPRIGQCIERRIGRNIGKRGRTGRQGADQAAQVGPAPVLVTPARQVGEIAGPEG